MRAILGAVLALAVLSTEAAAASGKITISKEAASALDGYLKDIGSTRGGAFAVTPDGTGWGFGTCEGTGPCHGAADYALKKCEQAAGVECIIFAKGDDIQVEYEVAP